MSKTAKKSNLYVVPNNEVIDDLAMDQLLVDPNQPRQTFSHAAIVELATSIKSQGLQQYPHVNPAFKDGVPILTKDGRQCYYIKAGERRIRAHKYLGLLTVKCVILKEVYDSTLDANRKLAQASENSSREPQTHVEIIAVMIDVTTYEMSLNTSRTKWGSIGVAIGRVAAAFGKSRGWAQQYHDLTKLHPDLRNLLDESDPDLKLSFGLALGLSRAALDKQVNLWEEAKKLKEKGGHKLMLSYITRQGAISREESGAKHRGRKLSDDKELLKSLVNRVYRDVISFVGERHSSEFNTLLDSVISKMGAVEVDQLLGSLNQSAITLNQIRDTLKKRREQVYSQTFRKFG